MPFKELKIAIQHGKQYVPDLKKAQVDVNMKGLPVISAGITVVEASQLKSLCPAGAINDVPFSIDLGKCMFCLECQWALPGKIKFTSNYKTASNVRENLLITAGNNSITLFEPDKIRKEIKGFFRHALKLRQVSAGGDNSAEMELNAAGNVNFDMGRFGIEFVASPRHADGIVLTGPITNNMAEALQITQDAIPYPKILVLAGTDAISGGMYAESGAVNRSFLNKYHIDLFVPGNPPHPLTFINGILGLIGR